MPVHPKVDVVTIGGGWTSAILGWKLGEAGYSVVAVEQGPARWTTPDFQHNHDHLRYTVRKALMHDISQESWTWRPNPRAPSLPLRRYGAFHPGAGVGGAAIHWSAMLWRFLPSDFRYRSHHVERYGADKLPEGMTAQDWPISYYELEEYYDQFEWDLGTSGKAGNLLGELQEGGNIFEGPRRREFALPPIEVTIPAKMFAEATQRMGYHPFPQPSGILSRARTDPFGFTRSGCLYCGFCTRFGCEVDAKGSPITTHTRLALRTNKYEIRTNAKVIRINTGADGLATGITYIGPDGQEHEQPAEVVIVSAYALSNVRLLLLSRSQQHPNGIGNDRNMVGKSFTYQLWKSPVTGVFEGRRFNLYAGNTSTINVIYDYNADNFDHSDLDFVGGAQIFCGMGERDPLGAVEELPTQNGSNGENGEKRWGREFKQDFRLNWDGYVPITIQAESLPYVDQYLDLDPVYRDRYGLPLLRLTFDWHRNDYNLYRFIAARTKEIMEEMGPTRIDDTAELEPFNVHEYQSTHITGGAIMGSDPGNSVTNRYGQVWDTPNVFVTGSALYPQNPGANPTDTLAALAYMTGDAMRDRYFKDPNRLLA
jgi:gluconate 2-dehydrogenase alpha chain